MCRRLPPVQHQGLTAFAVEFWRFVGRLVVLAPTLTGRSGVIELLVGLPGGQEGRPGGQEGLVLEQPTPGGGLAGLEGGLVGRLGQLVEPRLLAVELGPVVCPKLLVPERALELVVDASGALVAVEPVSAHPFAEHAFAV